MQDRSAVLGQKKAFLEYMALPHPEIETVWMLSTHHQLLCCTDLLLAGHAICSWIRSLNFCI